MPVARAVGDPSSGLAPLVVEVTVPAPPGRAFDYFTRDIARWWPLGTHSVGRESAANVAFEGGAGGRLVETTRDGARCIWGTVDAWEPGARVRFSWHPGRDETTAQWVEVTFVAVTGGTRVRLTHGGWEALEDDAASTRDNYVGGWALVFSACYGAYCSREGRSPD
jgi:uncharacterized protein YndB with AHSA1/START domain